MCAGSAAFAWAGDQKEEQLSDAVRLALAGQIADSTPRTPDFRNPNHLVDYLLWLATESTRLSSRIPNAVVREAFLRTVWYEEHRAGLEPALVLAAQHRELVTAALLGVALQLGHQQPQRSRNVALPRLHGADDVLAHLFENAQLCPKDTTWR